MYTEEIVVSWYHVEIELVHGRSTDWPAAAAALESYALIVGSSCLDCCFILKLLVRNPGFDPPAFAALKPEAVISKNIVVQISWA